MMPARNSKSPPSRELRAGDGFGPLAIASTQPSPRATGGLCTGVRWFTSRSRTCPPQPHPCFNTPALRAVNE
jgi:hypothetical protein